jgi:hypothetical protein
VGSAKRQLVQCREGIERLPLIMAVGISCNRARLTSTSVTERASKKTDRDPDSLWSGIGRKLTARPWSGALVRRHHAVPAQERCGDPELAKAGPRRGGLRFVRAPRDSRHDTAMPVSEPDSLSAVSVVVIDRAPFVLSVTEKVCEPASAAVKV